MSEPATCASALAEVRYMESCGCRQIGLGKVRMPAGYSLWLDADPMYYFWMRHSDGVTSVINCNRWAVYRSAVAAALRQPLPPPPQALSAEGEARPGQGEKGTPT